jgi:hypothetical protein
MNPMIAAHGYYEFKYFHDSLHILSVNSVHNKRDVYVSQLAFYEIKRLLTKIKVTLYAR